MWRKKGHIRWQLRQNEGKDDGQPEGGESDMSDRSYNYETRTGMTYSLEEREGETTCQITVVTTKQGWGTTYRLEEEGGQKVRSWVQLQNKGINDAQPGGEDGQ